MKIYIRGKPGFRLKQKSIDGNYIEEFWEAPSIGSVRAVMRIGGGTITLALREFKRGRN